MLTVYTSFLTDGSNKSTISSENQTSVGKGSSSHSRLTSSMESNRFSIPIQTAQVQRSTESRDKSLLLPNTFARRNLLPAGSSTKAQRSAARRSSLRGSSRLTLNSALQSCHPPGSSSTARRRRIHLSVNTARNGGGLFLRGHAALLPQHPPHPSPRTRPPPAAHSPEGSTPSQLRTPPPGRGRSLQSRAHGGRSGTEWAPGATPQPLTCGTEPGGTGTPP